VQTPTIEDAEAVAREVPTIARWTPGVRGRAQVIAGNNNWNTQVEGGNEDFLAVRNWVVADGANFTARDVLVAEKVCLLGATVARTLFPDSDPVGQIIRIRNMPFRVLGVLAAKGQGQWGQDQDDFVVAPWTTVQRKLLGINYIHQVSLTARSSELVEPTAVAITRLMRSRHRITNPENDDFSVRTIEEMAATRVQMAETMTGLLMSVASVSLLVGGIGIMNIMLVSVTERTREIGVRMAVGAKTRDVMRQFLAEAIALSLVGGIAGIVLGVAVSETITQSLGWPVAITGAEVLIAFVFSAAVGIFFGWYPARKAANLDPIEACATSDVLESRPWPPRSSSPRSCRSRRPTRSSSARSAIRRAWPRTGPPTWWPPRSSRTCARRWFGSAPGRCARKACSPPPGPLPTSASGP
jgi:putative ABC transport system permease protein